MIKIDNKRSLGFEIKTIDNMITRELISSWKTTDLRLTTIQVGIMGYLHKNRNKEIYQKDLEEIFNIRRSTISGILKTMEKNQLIKRVDAKKDARIKQIIITNFSVDLENKMKAEKEKLEKKLAQNISNQDLQTFYKVIDQIKQNIS